MVELAQRPDGDEPINASHIAAQGNIPEKYLVHILLQLKRNGLVRSLRGSQGGYVLERQAESITLLDIVIAIDGPILEPLPAEERGRKELGVIWQTAGAGISGVLGEITLQQIMDSLSNTDMYYI